MVISHPLTLIQSNIHVTLDIVSPLSEPVVGSLKPGVRKYSSFTVSPALAPPSPYIKFRSMVPHVLIFTAYGEPKDTGLLLKNSGMETKIVVRTGAIRSQGTIPKGL